MATTLIDDVRAEAVRVLYRQTVPVSLTNVLNSGIVGVALWHTASPYWIVVWQSAMVMLAIARAVLTVRYRTGAARSDPAVWGTRFTIGSAASGALWGCAGFFFLVHANGVQQLLVSFVIGGMCAAAAGTTASLFAAFQAFCLPALTGLAIRMLLFGDATHVTMAVLIVIYAIALSVVARTNNRVLTEAFTLRFENETLVEQVSGAREQLEDANRTLEQKVVERTKALQKQGEALRDAQRMEAVGRLAGGVAHDFNNLLTIILSNISDISRHSTGANPHSKAIREIHEATTRAADLVRQLLLFSRGQTSTPRTLDLNDIVRAMGPLLQRLLGDQLNLQLAYCEAALWVRMDRTQLEQIVVNLVANARDATPHGGRVNIATSEVTFAGTADDDGIAAGTYAVLTVSDTGTGMDSDTQQHIFDPFFTTKDVGQGTGLGLATVYGIVQQCSGAIRVKSEVNRGSTFSVYIPSNEGPGSMKHIPSELESGLGTSTPPNATTVLLVEDEPTVLRVARRILKRGGYRVLAADNAEHALTLSSRHVGTIDILITDVMMPEMGGPALAKLVRAQRPNIRTLYVSGYSRDQGILQEDLALGAMFLAKPFTDELLIAKTIELMEVKAPVQE